MLCLLIQSVLPESARWLVSKNRHAEAKKILLNAAKMNKKEIPEHLLSGSDPLNDGAAQLEQEQSKDNNSSTNPFKILVQILKTPCLVKRLLIILLLS